jgi:hypothetical protein
MWIADEFSLMSVATGGPRFIDNRSLNGPVPTSSHLQTESSGIGWP